MAQLSAVEAEATGQLFVVATVGGVEFKLPTDVEDWPLHHVVASLGVRIDKPVVQHRWLTAALEELLRDQWSTFLDAAPKRRDLVAASQAFAAAAGFEATAPIDKAFGALPRRLATITQWPDAVEATLRRVGLDYRDRWRFDSDHRRLLTLRQIHVELSNSALDSPIRVAMNGGKLPLSDETRAVLDLFEAITGRKHPSRPLTAQEQAERARAEAKQQSEKGKYADYRKRHNLSPAAARNEAAIDRAKANAKASLESQGAHAQA